MKKEKKLSHLSEKAQKDYNLIIRATEEKDQQTPEKKPLIQREVMDLYNFAIPEEI